MIESAQLSFFFYGSMWRCLPSPAGPFSHSPSPLIQGHIYTSRYTYCPYGTNRAWSIRWRHGAFPLFPMCNCLSASSDKELDFVWEPVKELHFLMFRSRWVTPDSYFYILTLKTVFLSHFKPWQTQRVKLQHYQEKGHISTSSVVTD